MIGTRGAGAPVEIRPAGMSSMTSMDYIQYDCTWQGKARFSAVNRDRYVERAQGANRSAYNTELSRANLISALPSAARPI